MSNKSMDSFGEGGVMWEKIKFATMPFLELQKEVSFHYIPAPAT